MTPEERVIEIRRIAGEYAALSIEAMRTVQQIHAVHRINPNSSIITDLLWRIRRIKGEQIVLDQQLAKLGARRLFEDVIPSSMPEDLQYDEASIQPGKSSKRK